MGLFTLAYFVASCDLASLKPFWFDELTTYNIARSPTAGDVWRAWLEPGDAVPPLVHLATHFIGSAVGFSHVTARLPDMLGFWLMCMCVFIFLRRRVCPLLALVGMLLPLTVPAAYAYAYESRGYGMVAGFSGAAVLCWDLVYDTRWRRVALLGPPVHFVAIGVALFAVERYATPMPKAERPTVTITAARLAQLEGDSRRSTDVALEREALLERAIEEEVLFREALARGLDRDDQSIQFRLAEKMRFLVASEGAEDDAGTTQSGVDRDLYREAVALGLEREDPLVRGILVHKMRLLLKRTSGAPSPDDGELRAYLERHRDRYLQPARVWFEHVYLARARGGNALDRDARRLLDQLRAHGTPRSEGARRRPRPARGPGGSRAHRPRAGPGPHHPRHPHDHAAADPASRRAQRAPARDGQHRHLLCLPARSAASGRVGAVMACPHRTCPSLRAP